MGLSTLMHLISSERKFKIFSCLGLQRPCGLLGIYAAVSARGRYDCKPQPDTMADIEIAKCVRKRWLNAFFAILILFGAHILSFHE